MDIREATEADIEAVSRLWLDRARWLGEQDRRLSPPLDALDRWRAHFRDSLGIPDRCVFVTFAADQISGYVIAQIETTMTMTRYAFIRDLTLDMHRHRPGAARALVMQVRAWASRCGVDRFAAAVAPRDVVARAFWDSLGAVPGVSIVWLS